MWVPSDPQVFFLTDWTKFRFPSLFWRCSDRWFLWSWSTLRTSSELMVLKLPQLVTLPGRSRSMGFGWLSEMIPWSSCSFQCSLHRIGSTHGVSYLFRMYARRHSSWPVSLEFNAYNGYLFNIQARSLNNLVYWIAQIIGSVLIGFLLDHKAIKRRARAFVGWSVLFVVVFAVHIWAYFYQKYVFSLFVDYVFSIHFLS